MSRWSDLPEADNRKGSELVAKREWGTKRLCTGCGARFYDLQKNPITCPSCNEVHVPEVATKSRRSAAARQRTKPKLAVVEKATVPSTATLETVSDGTNIAPTDADADAGADAAAKIDVDDDDKDSGDVIEDASELGEDEDDMAEVIEGSREAKED